MIYWSCLWSCSCHHDDANLVRCVIFDCWFKSEIITFIKINIYINWIISRCFFTNVNLDMFFYLTNTIIIHKSNGQMF